MKFHILTLFPEMVRQGLVAGIIGRAVDRGLLELNTVNIRDFADNRHGKIDDYPYGGGAGMLMQAQPVFDAWKSIRSGSVRTIYVTPQGEPFTQNKAWELSHEKELIILCGHYEGIDERVLEETVTDYISIGDYVLTGGELAAMVLVDAVGRLVPGVLGNETSAEAESFHGDLLEYPQYSRPEIWHGKKVPEVLLSGNHRLVESWRLERAKERTAAVRPDMYRKYEEKQALIKSLSKEKRNHVHMMESLAGGRGEVLCREGEELLIADARDAVCMLLCKCGYAERLLAIIPDKIHYLVVIQEQLAEELAGHGFEIRERCSQYLYTTGQALPVRYKEIRRLTAQDMAYVRGHCGEAEAHIRKSIDGGEMYGAFAGEKLIGFAGVCAGGGMGMLYVEEGYRGQGIGEALLSYQINRLTERGKVPYSQVPQYSPERGVSGNAQMGYGYSADTEAGCRAAEHLLEKLGFYKAEKTIWRLGRSGQY